MPDEPPITDSDREHWSFRPVERPPLPDVSDADWCRTPVDQFILAELDAREVEPMPETDRLTLLRRVTSDLTGLPPTPAEIDEFLADDLPGAYGRVVDRLLASPAYGERWGQHWLDLARFAETDGFEHDIVRPNAWRYRDWVIDALNTDLPYDDFVRLQLAGDELYPDDPAAAVATGFLLCGPDMPDINLQEERRHNFLNDMTGTVGAVFLALQMQCASCHDHKYDPISQADFYRLRAFFDPADVFGEWPIPTADDRAAVERFEKERAERWKALEAEIKSLRNDESEESATRLEELKEDLAALKEAEGPAVTMGRVVHNPRRSPDPSRLWIRGDFRRPGPELKPGFVRVVAFAPSTAGEVERSAEYGKRNADGDDGPRIPTSRVPQHASRITDPASRTALANWLVDPRQPLTARVMVNRIWQHHFGRGLVETASDFGVMGDWPTHPELLDWLAGEFIEHGWSIKQMHRLLVTSSVYRTMSGPRVARYGKRDTRGESRIPQAASPSEDEQIEIGTRWELLVERDPRNTDLGRMRRGRLDGEAIRDAMLSAAGLLNRESGGPGVRPPLPDEVTSTLLKNQWPVTPGESQHVRRSVYLFVRRNLPYPLFAVFDRPDTNQSCPQRNETTIAPQALQLLNSEFALTCALTLARRVKGECGDNPAACIERAYLLTLARPPTGDELEAGQKFLAAGGSDALVDFCLALFNLNEFVYID